MYLLVVALVSLAAYLPQYSLWASLMVDVALQQQTHTTHSCNKQCIDLGNTALSHYL